MRKILCCLTLLLLLLGLGQDNPKAHPSHDHQSQNAHQDNPLSKASPAVESNNLDSHLVNTHILNHRMYSSNIWATMSTSSF